MSVFVYQYLVAGSSLLAALAVGCSVGYPSVLLQQLSSNDTTIQLDWDTASWIGSIHGIAGIPSLILPAIIQWQGRRLGFILACLISIIGWIISYTATNTTSILIAESFNGFGAQCISCANSFTMSEMLSPQIRKMAIGLYLVVQMLGIAVIQFGGSYLHWRTVSLIVSVPLILTVMACFTWPESPSWLAYRGEFDKCERAFTRLRGKDDNAQSELEELILAQKESLSKRHRKKEPYFRTLLKTLRRRDFYMPIIHMFVLLQTVYWTGCIAHLIYAADIVEHATYSKDSVFFGNMAFNSATLICCVIGTFLIKFLESKKVFIFCITSAVICLLSASTINYLQSINLMIKSTIALYFLIGFMFSFALTLPILLPLTAELMPVKHRGLGGPIYSVILPCILHTTLLKSVPYMLLYIKLYGMLLIFATNGILCTLFTWYFIPETKGRTLQQLEDFYNYGNFDKCRKINKEKCMSELMPLDTSK